MLKDVYDGLEKQADELSEMSILATVIKAEAKVSNIKDIQKDFTDYVESLENIAKKARILLESNQPQRHPVMNFFKKNDNVTPIRKD